MKPSNPKGMRDFTPALMCKRNYVFGILSDAFQNFGYMPIETPAIENLSTLSNKYGDDGDKLIFKILNSGNFLANLDSLSNTDYLKLTNKISNKALRYDLTVPFARFVSQNRNEIVFPFKRYQMQNVWRADRPQKGRYREFYQCDADVVGTDSLLCEVELIQLYDRVFTDLKIPSVVIYINNRKILSAIIELMDVEEMFDEIVILLDKIDKVGFEVIREKLIERKINSDAINILEKYLSIVSLKDLRYLLKDSKIGIEGIDELQFIFNSIQITGLDSSKLLFNPALARGIDYYTGSILEVVTDKIQIGSLGGGGRYDNLTSVFGFQNISGVGVSFGFERIFIVMQELNLFPADLEKNIDVLFINFGNKEANYCLPIIKKLRSKNISSELYPSSVKLKKQMAYANNNGIKYVVLAGEEEILSKSLTVKDMKKGDQYKMSVEDLISLVL